MCVSFLFFLLKLFENAYFPHNRDCTTTDDVRVRRIGHIDYQCPILSLERRCLLKGSEAVFSSLSTDSTCLLSRACRFMGWRGSRGIAVLPIANLLIHLYSANTFCVVVQKFLLFTLVPVPITLVPVTI